jgi:hypothetical protein
MLIFWFVCMQFATNLTASILELLIITNYSVYAANVILSFSLLSFIFYRTGIVVLKRMVTLAIVLFLACAIYSIGRGDGIMSYNSVLSALSSFTITGYCLVYFYWRLVKDTQVSGLTENAFFWIMIGVFTYYTGSFFIFISYKYLIVHDAGIIGILWRFHNLLLTIFCGYTIYGITCKNYQRT